MPEAVIVATARTPIGRANKGSLVECRPDDLVGARSSGRPRARCPQLDPAQVEDVIWGCGQPAGEAGYNIAPRRRAPRRARRAGRDRQPLLLVVAPDHPHGGARDQGRRGRRVRRRRRRDREPVHERRGRRRPARTPKFADAEAAHAERTRGRQPVVGAPARACPTSTSRWARPPRTSPSTSERQSRRAWTSSPPSRSSAPSTSQENGFFEREITPVTLADGTVVTKDDGPRAGTTVEKLARAQAGVPSRRRGHRRQRVPAERRRRRGRRDERHEARSELGITPLARIVASGVVRAQPRDHGPRPDRGVPSGAEAGRA